MVRFLPISRGLSTMNCAVYELFFSTLSCWHVNAYIFRPNLLLLYILLSPTLS